MKGSIMIKPWTLRACLRATAFASLILVYSVSGSETEAQQISKNGWDASPRSKSLSSQFQFQRKQTRSSGGMDALSQYITNYNTSSTSIGNYTEVFQTLGEGANGTVTQNSTQDNSGTQTTDTTATDNETTNGSFNPTVAGKGKSSNTAITDGSRSEN